MAYGLEIGKNEVQILIYTMFADGHVWQGQLDRINELLKLDTTTCSNTQSIYDECKEKLGKINEISMLKLAGLVTEAIDETYFNEQITNAILKGNNHLCQYLNVKCAVAHLKLITMKRLLLANTVAHSKRCLSSMMTVVQIFMIEQIIFVVITNLIRRWVFMNRFSMRTIQTPKRIGLWFSAVMVLNM